MYSEAVSAFTSTFGVIRKVTRREKDCVGMFAMEIAVQRKGRRPKRNCLDRARADIIGERGLSGKEV